MQKQKKELKMKRTKRFVRIEDIRFPILEYKDGKINAKKLVEKLEKIINELEL